VSRRDVAAFVAGALFATGLVVSGMTRPDKVLAFLDVLGHWDASLLLVMAGAIAVHALAYRLVLRRGSPLFDVRFHVPARRDIDLRILLGAAIFGIGWGIAGYCPGPALVSAAGGAVAPVVFVLAMAAGMLLEPPTRAWRRR
jgi:uncharacterized membrane protein YedE/YeeE